MAFLVGGANSAAADTGYDIDNSLRFNDDDSPDLGITLGTPSTANVFTFSFWFKLGDWEESKVPFSAGTDSNNFDQIVLQNDGTIIYHQKSGGSNTSYIQPSALYRDSSAWYHLVVGVDTTQSTDTNRIKMYVNGSQISSFDTETYCDQNEAAEFNTAVIHTVGTHSKGDTHADYMDGYLADFYFIDGTQYAASDFGETDEDSGIWKPKEAKDDLTFGDNGFFLEFKGTGASQDSSGIGADTSGEDNHLAVTNLAATDQTTDTPTNNFATMNPLDAGSEATLSEGNCKYTGGTTVGQSQLQMCGGTFGVSNGKWYFEVKRISNNAFVGIYAADHGAVNIGYTNAFQSGWNGYSHGIYTSDGNARNGNADTAYGSAIDDDDIIGVALDLDNGAIYYSDNGTFMDSGDPTSGASKTGAASNFTTTVETWILGFISDGSSGASGVYEFNFGNPSFAISSGNADANGYGNFEYAVPSGYYAPCTKNLAEYG